MTKIRDLSGNRFTNLLVIKRVEQEQGKAVSWECRCDCGNITKVRAGNLLSGNTTSCGCLGSRNKSSEIAGVRFGKLIALYFTGKYDGTAKIWSCKCDCGNIIETRASSLLAGNTTSCGCYNSESSIKNLIGKSFGSFTVIEDTKKRKSNGKVIWKCECKCGNVIESSLLSKRKSSLICNKCGYKEKYKDFIGQSFGKLTVIDIIKNRVFLCKCACGNTIIKSKHQLEKNKLISCGCLKQTFIFIDLVGQKFNRLTVMKLSPNRKYNVITWECKCDCGNTTEVTSVLLTTNRIKSCGCLSIEKLAERQKQYRLSRGFDADIPLSSNYILARTKFTKLKLSRKVFIRDKFKCVLCGKNSKLNAHHILSFSEHEEKRFTMDNLVTLCKDCHFVKVHNNHTKSLANKCYTNFFIWYIKQFKTNVEEIIKC